MNPDNLEKYILRNRERFDDLEPDPAVWDRIEKRKAPVLKINWKDVAWKAAAVVIIFTASYYFHDYMSSRKQKAVVEAALQANMPMVRELLEAEAFYTSRINNKKEELFQMTSENPSIHTEVDAEFKELDKAFNELKNDLNDDADNQEVIEAMIQNYRIKLQILEDLLYQIQQVNQTQNDKKNGKERIEI